MKEKGAIELKGVIKLQYGFHKSFKFTALKVTLEALPPHQETEGNNDNRNNNYTGIQDSTFH